MRKIYQINHELLLRWRFVFSDHKPDKFGMWSQAGTCEHTKAWAINKENLAYAIIETKNQFTREIRQPIVCEGWDFVNFQWESAVGFNLSSGLNKKRAGSILGLSIVTRDKKATVYIDGKIKTRERRDEEKLINFAGFGK